MQIKKVQAEKTQTRKTQTEKTQIGKRRPTIVGHAAGAGAHSTSVPRRNVTRAVQEDDLLS